MSTTSISSLGLPKSHSTPNESEERLDNRCQSNSSVHINIGLIEKAKQLKDITTKKLNGISQQYNHINERIRKEISRIKNIGEENDSKIVELDNDIRSLQADTKQIRKKIQDSGTCKVIYEIIHVPLVTKV